MLILRCKKLPGRTFSLMQLGRKPATMKTFPGFLQAAGRKPGLSNQAINWTLPSGIVRIPF